MDRWIDRIMYGSDYWTHGLFGFSNAPADDFKRWIELIRTGINGVAEKAGWPQFTKCEIEGILGNNAARLHRLA